MTEPDFIRDTRASYDAIASAYAERFAAELSAKPLDRRLLDAFAGFVGSGGRVADVGCGTGRVTAYLTGLGLDVFGIDLSPGMIAAARERHPGLPFAVGSMLGLELADESVDGLLVWYSLIHVPEARVPDALAELRRVLRPGGYALFGFQAGDGTRSLGEALGHPVTLDFHRRRPEHLAELLTAAGLEVRASVLREREEDGPFPERTPQGFLLARRAG